MEKLAKSRPRHGKGVSNKDSKNEEGSAAESKLADLRAKQQKERQRLSLLGSPLSTMRYFVLSLAEQLVQAPRYLLRSRIVIAFLLTPLLVLLAAVSVDGPDHLYLHTLWAYGRFFTWWLLLGIMSSIGLGSGLHTFVLYLGPHIARFTLKATACGRVDFKEALYDTAQWHQEPSWTKKDCMKFGPPVFQHIPSEHGGYYSVPLLHLMAAVQLESFLWGLGTAIGELPPYFVSRAARLSGEKVKELEELEQESPAESNPIFQQLKVWMFSRAQSFGFFTILAFASVPNPLFDLAGITCGHFLVPFWKFFLATAIGKSICKTSLQTVFIVTVFNARSVEILELLLSQLLGKVPVLKDQLPAILSAIDDVRNRFSGGEYKASALQFTLSSIWSAFVLLMLLIFFASVVSSMARGYLLEQQQAEMEALQKRLKKRKT